VLTAGCIGLCQSLAQIVYRFFSRVTTPEIGKMFNDGLARYIATARMCSCRISCKNHVVPCIAAQAAG